MTIRIKNKSQNNNNEKKTLKQEELETVMELALVTGSPCIETIKEKIEKISTTKKFKQKKIEKEEKNSENSEEISKNEKETISTLKDTSGLFDGSISSDNYYTIEFPSQNKCETIPLLVIETTFEPFRNYFFKKTHFNYVCPEIFTILSVLYTPKDGKHKTLITSPKGQASADILVTELSNMSSNKENLPINEQILEYIEKKMYPSLPTSKDGDSGFYQVKEKSFQLEILGLEASHAVNATAFRIGIIYSAPHQSKEEDMLKNDENSASTNFKFFLGLMGDRISLGISFYIYYFHLLLFLFLFYFLVFIYIIFIF